MPKPTSTYLYGGVERPAYRSQTTKCSVPTAFVGILGILRIAQEGFSFDMIGVSLLIVALLIHMKFQME